MPRAGSDRDVAKEAWGNKSVQLRVRISPEEEAMLDKVVAHGGFRSVSHFLRVAMLHVGEQVLSSAPVALRESEAELEFRSIAPRVPPSVERPPAVEQVMAPPPVSHDTRPPSLSDILGVPLYASDDNQQMYATGDSAPMEAPLDFDDDGWVG